MRSPGTATGESFPLVATREKLHKAMKTQHSHSVLIPESCPPLCNSMNCSPPASSAHGILQARILGVGCHSLPNPGLLHGSHK